MDKYLIASFAIGCNRGSVYLEWLAISVLLVPLLIWLDRIRDTVLLKFKFSIYSLRYNAVMPSQPRAKGIYYLPHTLGEDNIIRYLLLVRRVGYYDCTVELYRPRSPIGLPYHTVPVPYTGIRCLCQGLFISFGALHDNGINHPIKMTWIICSLSKNHFSWPIIRITQDWTSVLQRISYSHPFISQFGFCFAHTEKKLKFLDRPVMKNFHW